MIEAEIKTIEPMTVAYLAMKGPYSQMTAGYDTLYYLVGTRHYSEAGWPMAVYLSDPAQGQENAVWELWAPMQDIGVELLPEGESPIGVKRIPEMTVASTTHTGSYDELGPVYEELIAWMAENGHTIAGAPQEIYLNDPEQVKPSEYVTEIRFPVESP